MGKDKNKNRNNEEEMKLGEISLRKLIEAYSYNIVVDQFFMKTSKKIVDIDKILRNLKNKTGSAFVAKFLYENRKELSELEKSDYYSNINFSLEKQKKEKKFIEKKRKKIKRKILLDEINEGERKLQKEERKKRYLAKKENEFSYFRGGTYKTKENIKKSLLQKDKNIYTQFLVNLYGNIKPLEYLPNKSIEERIKTMKGKIFAIFPELEDTKINEEMKEMIENELQKKKEISSVNESHSTKEIDII